MSFEISIWPAEGYYLFKVFTKHVFPPWGHKFLLSFQVYCIYPHELPKAKCKTKVCCGNICLNILRRDRNSVLNINTVIYGQYHLFTEPNSKDPLNHDAAAELRDNPKLFH
ncbi:unnamed protein product [Coffea canephora]|uniref:UBC core domain-containing protein n=1 Tax=Coffea canephora TaxID=49390 RepID=A0A068UCF8_COFCA|nr:unnamed protein product [Coffea canephora]